MAHTGQGVSALSHQPPARPTLVTSVLDLASLSDFHVLLGTPEELGRASCLQAVLHILFSIYRPVFLAGTFFPFLLLVSNTLPSLYISARLADELPSAQQGKAGTHRKSRNDI